jgi:hypothetical protein
MFDSVTTLNKFSEAAQSNSSLPPDFAEVLVDPNLPLSSLKYAK